MLPPDFDKKYYLSSFLSTVYGISSKEYQKRVWIEGRGPEVDDYDETYISFGNCDCILEHWKEFELTEIQKKSILELRDAFYDFGQEYDWPPFFIDSPEWAQIMEMAKEVLKAFNYTYPKEN